MGVSMLFSGERTESGTEVRVSDVVGGAAQRVPPAGVTSASDGSAE